MNAIAKVLSFLILLFALNATMAHAASIDDTQGAIWRGSAVDVETTYDAIEEWIRAHPDVHVVKSRDDGLIYIPNPTPDDTGHHDIARFAPDDPNGSRSRASTLVLVSIQSRPDAFELPDRTRSDTWVRRPDLITDNRPTETMTRMPTVAAGSMSDTPVIDAAPPAAPARNTTLLTLIPHLPPLARYLIITIVVLAVILMIAWAETAINALASRPSRARIQRARIQTDAYLSRMAKAADRSDDLLNAAQREFQETVDALNRAVKEVLR